MSLPFAEPEKQQQSNLIEAEQQRFIHEVQAALVIGKKFPRDQNKAYANIMTACKRKGLAESAIYAYPRGGKTVTGPSIRLAEVIAQNWGNIMYGIRELEQHADKSIMQAYCWDTENNVKREQNFIVRHERKANSQITRLEDPRDKYENTANMGARRVRACILGVIPRDVVDEAEAACKKTLEAGDGTPLVDRVRKMVSAFQEIGVTKEMLEKRLGHKLEATQAAELPALISIFNSLRDGASSVDQWFETPKVDDKAESLKDKTKGKAKQQVE